MEARSNHLVLGAATLVFLLGGLGFVLWLAEVGIGQTRYRLAFEQSVAGLAVGSPVRVNGVQVGTVQAIALDAERPERAIVSIAVAAEVPLHADATATLGLQSIAAGRLYVALSAGSADAPRLGGADGGPPPEIETERSRIAELMDAAPAVMDRLVRVGDRLARLLEADGGRIAEAVEEAAAAAAALRGAGEAAEGLAGPLRDTVRRAQRAFAAAEIVMEDDVPALLGAGTASLTRLEAAAAELEAVVAENRRPVHALTTRGFLEARHLVNETRLLVEEIRTLAERIRRDPSRLLRGSESATFRPEERR